MFAPHFIGLFLTAGVLAFAPPTTGPDGVDPARAQWQAGIDEQRAGHHADAVAHFERALDLGAEDPRLRLYLASSLLQQARFVAAREALDGTESLAADHVAQPLLLARAQLGAGEPDAAYDTLAGATAQHPEDPAPRLELVALCTELSMRAEARAWGWTLVGLELDRDTVLAVFDLLYADERAHGLLEALAASDPDDADMVGHLAYAYAAHEHWYVAATLFERATLAGEDHAFEAADQFRMAGDTRAALALNARVQPRTRQLDQRLSILVGAGEMARVVALAGPLAEAGLDAPRHRYNLAFAHYALGEYARAAELARDLLDSPLAGRARALLDAMGRAP